MVTIYIYISGCFLNVSDIHSIQSDPFKPSQPLSKNLPWFNNLIETSFNASLGDGHILKFWEDKWMQNQTLRDKFPKLYNVSLQQSHLICDMGVCDENE